MNRGAFAMFDALGTKGIWRRYDSDQVVDKFRRLRAEVDRFLDSQFGGKGRPHLGGPGNNLQDVQIGFLSDTVVLAVLPKSIPERQEQVDEFCLILAARFAGTVMRLAAADEPRWAYRGCITFGQFASDARTTTFFVGPAVDEAAGMMNEAQGAFVFLPPSSRVISSNGFRAAIEPGGHLVPYSVPIKGIGSVPTYVVSPFDVDTKKEESEMIANNMIATFTSDTLDVAVKKENTASFYRAVLPWWHARLDRVDRLLADLDPKY